jgi:uncharacterized damage-inducible protein DinB
MSDLTIDRLIAELDLEASATRRVLERVPEDRLTWKPHDKSLSLGQLALHVASIPGAIADYVSEPIREVPPFSHPGPSSRAEILAALDRSLETAKARLSEWRDGGLDATWTMTQNGATIATMPRRTFVRTVMFNHLYHHRGQLQVYLRLLDVKVPVVYGNSADEGPGR